MKLLLVAVFFHDLTFLWCRTMNDFLIFELRKICIVTLYVYARIFHLMMLGRVQSDHYEPNKSQMKYMYITAKTITFCILQLVIKKLRTKWISIYDDEYRILFLSFYNLHLTSPYLCFFSSVLSKLFFQSKV